MVEKIPEQTKQVPEDELAQKRAEKEARALTEKTATAIKEMGPDRLDKISRFVDEERRAAIEAIKQIEKPRNKNGQLAEVVDLEKARQQKKNNQ